MGRILSKFSLKSALPNAISQLRRFLLSAVQISLKLSAFVPMRRRLIRQF